MKAARINEWGQPVQIEDVPQPSPTNDEVLVRVHAASVNPVDRGIAAGYMQMMYTTPLTLGTDFSGEVVAVGLDVQHAQPGDAVYGFSPNRGTFAEYVVATAAGVAPKPQSLDHVHAAAVPLAGLSAWQTLDPIARRVQHRTGMYHFAILYPSRKELARAIARLFALHYPNAPTDHGVSQDHLFG